MLPGGSAPVGSQNAGFLKSHTRGLYTKFDKSVGGALPGGAPYTGINFQGPALKGMIQGGRWIGHQVEKQLGELIPKGEPGGSTEVNVVNSAYIPVEADNVGVTYGGGSPVGIGPSIIEREMPRGGLRQIAVEMSGGWNELAPAPAGVETRDKHGENVDRYGNLMFGRLPPEEEENAWDAFRRKYGFGIGMSAGFAASALVGRVAGPVAGASAFTAAQILTDTLLGEPAEKVQADDPYVGYLPGVNSGLNYGKWGNNVVRGEGMWGSVGAARSTGGFGAGRVRQADVLRQFGRRLSNAEFRQAYGYSPRTRRSSRGYGRRTYGQRSYGRSFRRGSGTASSLAYMKGMLAGMRRGYR